MANPPMATIVADFLTNAQYGIGFPASSLAATTLYGGGGEGQQPGSETRGDHTGSFWTCRSVIGIVVGGVEDAITAIGLRREKSSFR